MTIQPNAASGSGSLYITDYQKLGGQPEEGSCCAWCVADSLSLSI